MSKQNATMLVSRLLASYPGITIPQPEVYMAELTATLLKYPYKIGEDGLGAARRASPEHIPSVGKIEAECDKVGGTFFETATYARQWQAQAARQLGERAEFEREARAAPKDDRPPGNRANVFIANSVETQSHYDKMVARTEQPGTDPLDWYYGMREGRNGIWVSLGWVENLMGGRRESGLAHVSRYGVPV